MCHPKHLYKDLEIEIGKTWHLRARSIPVVIGALGLVKKGNKEFLDKIPGNPSLQEIQKIVLYLLFLSIIILIIVVFFLFLFICIFFLQFYF